MNGPQETEVKRQIEHGAQVQGANPKSHEHFVSVSSPLVFNDFAQNPTVVQAWSYSQIDMLYTNEAGYWRGMHFCETNMTPFWTGIATAGNGTGSGTGGALPATTYYLQVTGSDLQKNYETQIYQVGSGTAVGGSGAGSIAITTPATSGYTYEIYIGTVNTPQNLATATWTGQPTVGPYAGQAVAIPASTAVTITAVGLAQTPPAAPATGVTVYPVFVFGEEYFQCIELRKVEWTRLFEADKSDPLNQLRIVGWKFFQGWMITNQLFGARIECTVSNNGAFG
jgi:hypothetical protein